MPQAKLDRRLLEKIAARTGKSVKYVTEQVSKKAARAGIMSEAALIMMARGSGIGTASFLRRLPPHVQAQAHAGALEGAPARAVATKRRHTGNRASKVLALERALRDTPTTGLSERLSRLHPGLGKALTQAERDLGDRRRVSYMGTANELRELLRQTISVLAPDAQVKAASWYVQAQDAHGKPTRGQRLRFIFRDMGDVEGGQVVEDGADLVERLVERIAVSMADRSNRAAHTSRERVEVRRILDYVKPVLQDILDAGERKKAAGRRSH